MVSKYLQLVCVRLLRANRRRVPRCDGPAASHVVKLKISFDRHKALSKLYLDGLFGDFCYPGQCGRRNKSPLC
jgi:hypothetical protein